MHLAGIAVESHQPRRTVSRTTRFLQSAAFAALGAAGFLSLTGCGSNYRPVVAAINPVGPSAQPQKFAVALSDPGNGAPGLVTFVDFSGDSVLITANVGPAPTYLQLNSSGTEGYVINGDGTINNFAVVNTLLTSQILSTTLLSGANANSLFAQSANVYVTEPGRNATAQLIVTASTSSSSGSPLSLKQEFTSSNPTFVFGINTAGSRAYILSAGDTTSPASALGIDTSTNTPLSPAIPVGNDPVYGVMTADAKRAFVMNEKSNTVSVINAQTNQLDDMPGSAPGAPLNTIPVGTGPIWADFAPPLAELLVANNGSPNAAGSLSIVNIPLCNAATSTSPGNPNCDPNNPTDAIGFGNVLATVPAGINPVMVAALQDGTQAYIANSGGTTSCTNTDGSLSGNCSVWAVNLTTNLVNAKIPLACHPNYIAATTGAPSGRVYVVCNDGSIAAKSMTVLRTDNNTITQTIPLQGNGVSVRVTNP